MPGEDQERFEDYLELEHYIEQLQAEHVAHPPAELTPSQANIYRMAALFRSVSPEASEPRPEFAAELQARLEQELQQRPQQVEPQTAQRKKERKPLHYVSRRALLAGGAAVAASLVVGAGIERAVEQARQGSPPPASSDPYAVPIIAAGVPTTWHFVAALSDLGDKAIRFVSDTVVGYIIRDDGDDGAQNKGKIIAMSAACTHMGCIVQWQDADRKFHCPCHGGLFTEYGHADSGAASIRYLRPLPRFNTKVVDGKVYVEVPLSSCSTCSQAWQ
jgi:Rieske Fe-S protein